MKLNPRVEPVSISEGTSNVDESTKYNPESMGSHRAHRSQLTDNTPTDNSSVPGLEGMDKVIDDNNDGQIEAEEIQATGNVIETKSGPTNRLEASSPFRKFECYYCKQLFPGQDELIAHFDG
jgi:hypothetical protein